MDNILYKVKDVVSVIEEFAPLGIQESWDNSGLCIGSPESAVSSVLLGLDCTPELVDEAVSMFLSAVCARKVIVADLSGYLKGIIRNYRTKRRKLMQQSLPDEDRYMPESLDEWE